MQTVIQGIFATLAVLSPLVILVGIIKPSLYGGTRWRALLLGIGLLLLGGLGVNLFMSPEEREQARVQQEAREAQFAREHDERVRRQAAEQAERERLEAERRARDDAQREQRAAEARAQEQARQEQRQVEARAREQAERERREAEARPRILGAVGDRTIIVWRDIDNMAEGERLLDADVHRTQPQLLIPLIACMVPGGTQVVPVGASTRTSTTVLVVNGPQTGCRGAVVPQLIRAPSP